MRSRWRCAVTEESVLGRKNVFIQSLHIWTEFICSHKQGKKIRRLTCFKADLRKLEQHIYQGKCWWFCSNEVQCCFPTDPFCFQPVSSAKCLKTWGLLKNNGAGVKQHTELSYSAPRQIKVQRNFNPEIPQWLHQPLVSR